VTQETLDDWSDDTSEGDEPGSGTDDLVDTGPDPDWCLSFTVSGPWGHFRRVEGNIVKQTYRIIPRTTVAGLVAAVLGIGRDEYYDVFAPEVSWVAIEPRSELRTVNMPMNTLSTADEDMVSLNPRGKLSMKLPDPTKLRQQHNYEVLVDPAYRIDLALSDERRYEQLRETLSEGRSYYVPSLGLSEHLADIEYHGEFEIEDGPAGETVTVESAIPDIVDAIVPEADVEFRIERSPGFMKADSGGRTTTRYVSYAYDRTGGPLKTQDAPASRVDGRTVVFV